MVIATCKECNEITVFEGIQKDYICDNCFSIKDKIKMKKCNCGKEFFEMVEEKKYCKECFTEVFCETVFQCEKCQKYFNSDSMVEHKGNYYCNNCYNNFF